MSKRLLFVGVLATLAVACAQVETVEDGESTSHASQELKQVAAKDQVGAAIEDDTDPNVSQAAVAKSDTNPTSVVSTRLTVRVKRDGWTEIVDAIEVPGYIKLEKHLGRGHLYEVRSGDRVLAVQGVDLDFERRSLSPERDVSSDSDTAEVFIDIPGVGLSEVENAEVVLHKIAATHQEKRASIAALGRLERSRTLSLTATTEAPQLRKAIRAFGRRARPN